MSAFGGKADICCYTPRCPLMTQSGHQLRASFDLVNESRLQIVRVRWLYPHKSNGYLLTGFRPERRVLGAPVSEENVTMSGRISARDRSFFNDSFSDPGLII